jgi:hypothetical protein
MSLSRARCRSISRINVAVAVAEDSRARIYEVAAACRALGFEPALTLEGIGVFTGSVELKNLARLRCVTDVVAVAIERQPRLNAFQGAAGARCRLK